MEEKMQGVVKLTMGPAAGEKETAAELPEGLKEYWRNDPLRSQVIPRLLENTKFSFDEETVDHGEEGVLSSDKGDTEKFRIVSIETQLCRQEEILGGREALLYNTEVSGGALVGPIDENKAQQFYNDRVDQLSKALKKKPDFISFCEFAFPFVDIPSHMGETPVDLFLPETEQGVEEAVTLAATNIRDAALEKSKSKKMPFICYGSLHCLTSRYNLGVVSPGGALENDWEMKAKRTYPFDDSRETIAKEPRIGGGPILHKKRFPARRAGECARVPDDHKFRLYRHRLGLICVLICSDIMDLNQFANIIRLNQKLDKIGDRDRIFMVVVPTYNFSPVILESCKDLSLFARTNVLVTNACGERETSTVGKMPQSSPPSEFFFMGRTHAELRRSEPRIVERVRHKDDLWILDINLREQNRILNLTKPANNP